MNERLKTTIMLGCLIVLVYLAGYTVGEFSAYWIMAEDAARRVSAKAVRKFEPPSDTIDKD